MQSLMVFGGSGFLGAHCLKELGREWGSAAGARLVSASRDPAACPVNHSGVFLRSLDGRLERETRALLEQERPRQILLLAAMSRAQPCELDPLRAQRINAEFPGWVAQWAQHNSARLVFVSTDLVFGATPARSGFYRESEMTSPVSVYGKTKVEGEVRVLSKCPEALVVRLPLLYGASHGRGLGASDSLLRSIELGQRPRLFTDEWRTPLHVRDAARALVELLGREEHGLLHLAGPDRLTRYELGLEVLASAGGADPNLLEEVRRGSLNVGAPRASDCCLDAERARALLKTSLRGVRQALAEDGVGVSLGRAARTTETGSASPHTN